MNGKAWQNIVVTVLALIGAVLGAVLILGGFARWLMHAPTTGGIAAVAGGAGDRLLTVALFLIVLFAAFLLFRRVAGKK